MSACETERFGYKSRRVERLVECFPSEKRYFRRGEIVCFVPDRLNKMGVREVDPVKRRQTIYMIFMREIQRARRIIAKRPVECGGALYSGVGPVIRSRNEL